MALTRITKGVIKPNENYDTHNINSTGIVTAIGLDVNGNADVSGSLSVGGVLTYEDVTSIDSVGIITARTGLVSPYADIDDFVSVGSNIHLGNAGVITATSFVGSGAALTGIDATAIKDSGGNVKVQAQASGAMYTGIHTFSSGAEVGSNIKLGNAGVITATSFVGSGAALTGIDATAVKDSGGNVKIQAQASGAVYTGIHTFITLKSTSGTFTGDIDVDGHTNLDNLSVAGVSTFAGTLNASTVSSTAFIASGDLDVDGHTFLDNVSVAGVSTFSGILDATNTPASIRVAQDIQHKGDADTKITFPAADQISFETGGSNRLKIHTYSSNNNVEVDASSHLSLADNGSNGRFIYIGDGDASSTGYMHLQPGGGSQGFGGGIRLYSHSNSTNAGGVYIGKSHASSGAIIFGNGGMSPLNEYARITSTGNIGVAGATGTDFSLLDGVVINTANGSAGLLINSSSSSHNAYVGFSYGSGSGTSHADQYSAYIGRVGDNTLILGTNNNIRATLNPDGEFGVGVSPLRKLHVKSGSNSNDGAFRVESSSGNIMDMGTDGSMHFLNCVNNDPFRIKFAGNEALRLTHETSGNGTTTLQFYMVTNNSQGATPYIKGVCGTEADGSDSENAGGLEFHSKTGGSGTDINAMRISHNGRVSIGAHNIQAPTAALHVIGDTQGTNTAFQVGQDGGARYFRLNELNGQSNFDKVLMSFYDNTLHNFIEMQNTYAGAANMGGSIRWIGHAGGETGKISVYNRDANSSSNTVMELSASYVTKPSHPCFDANRTAGAVSSTSVIAFNVATTNNGNHYSTSNGRFTAPVDGRYQFWWGAIKNNTSSVVRLHMRKNGSSSNMNDGRQLRLDSVGQYGDNGAITLIAQLSKNDYVQVVVTEGTAYGSGSDYTYFCGTLLG